MLRAPLYFSLSSSYGSLSAFCSSRGEPVYIYEESIKHTHAHTHKKKQCFGGLDSFFFFAPFALLLPRWLSRRRHILSPSDFLVFHFFLSFCWVRVKMFIPAFKMAILCSWNYGGAASSRAEKGKRRRKNWAAAVHLPHKSFALLRLDVGNWLMASRDYYSSSDELGWRL
jgi:hypothetical protein